MIKYCIPIITICGRPSLFCKFASTCCRIYLHLLITVNVCDEVDSIENCVIFNS